MEKLLKNNDFLNISTHTIDAHFESLVKLEVPLLKEIFNDFLSTDGIEFYNQMSLAFPVNDFKNKCINLKYFHNGRIVMTGCRSINDATNTITSFLKIIKENYKILKISKDISDNIKVLNIRISMINTDISINSVINCKLNEEFKFEKLKSIDSSIIKELNDDYCMFGFQINEKKLTYIQKDEHHNYYIPIKLFKDGNIVIKCPKYRYIKLPKQKSKIKKKRSETVKLTINDDIKCNIELFLQFLKDNNDKLNFKNVNKLNIVDYYLPLIDYKYKPDEELRDLIINLYDMNNDLNNSTYEPCTYHGLNHKHIFMDNCESEEHDHSFLKNSKSSKYAKNSKTKLCKCEKGTCLVFQSGHIIMIAKTYKHISVLFEKMKNYFIDKKDEVIF